jgi:hypothetical protein
MKNFARLGLVGLVLTLFLSFIVERTVWGVASAEDVAKALIAHSFPAAAELSVGFEAGFSQGRIDPTGALHLIEKLAAAQGDMRNKEKILLIVTGALQDGLPAKTLVDKVAEGMTRNIPIYVILNGKNGQPRILGLEQRAHTLAEVRDLLYSKGVFIAEKGQSDTPSAIPLSHFDQLVSNISAALASYLEGGGSPLEGQILREEVGNRLSKMQGIIPAADVMLVLPRIKPEDLTHIALKVLNSQ